MCWMCVKIYVFIKKRSAAHKKNNEYIECCIFGFGSFTFRMLLSRMNMNKKNEYVHCNRCWSTQKRNQRKFKRIQKYNCAQKDTYWKGIRFSILLYRYIQYVWYAKRQNTKALWNILSHIVYTLHTHKKKLFITPSR